MAEDLMRKSFRPGEVIFQEGETGAEAYVIEDGSVEISKSDAGAELILSVLKPGEVIGEMALIDSSPRMATARAARKTTLIVIPKAVFSKIIGKTDAVVRVILMALLGRLRIQSKQYVDKTL
ncbi:MAG: cyclic nucleotide-binding domain-containing protein [Rhodospirillales bacterium]|nr:cyclic nucleotide-binding domain-containing protein [Rhodospirillales bacterium]